MGKRFRAAVCAGVAALAFGQNAHAQAVATADMFQISIGSVIRNWASRMGYSLADARVASTLTAVGEYASGLVGEGLIPAALTVGGAVTWGSVLGVAALAGGAAAIALDDSGSFSWLFTGSSSSPSITVTSPTSTSTTTTPDTSVTLGAQGSSAGTACSIVANSTGKQWVYATPVGNGNYSVTTYYSATTNSKPDSSWLSYGTNTCSGVFYYTFYKQVQTTTPCPSGDSLVNGACVKTTTVTTGGTVSGQTMDQAVGALTPGEESQKLTSDALKKLTDYLMSGAAAKPGYSGLPYSPATPVTDDDATKAIGSSGTKAPTVGALGSPVSNPQSPTSWTPSSTDGGLTIPDAGSSSGASSVTVNYNPCGNDPNLAGCADLGSASSPSVGASVVSVSMSPWSIGPASGTCPQPLSVDIFGQSYQVSYQPLCTVASGLQPVIVALGALAAALIVAMGLKS